MDTLSSLTALGSKSLEQDQNKPKDQSSVGDVIVDGLTIAAKTNDDSDTTPAESGESSVLSDEASNLLDSIGDTVSDVGETLSDAAETVVGGIIEGITS